MRFSIQLRLLLSNSFFRFFLACCALTFFKFWLVSEDEILAQFAPHDQLWQIRAADHLLKSDWFGPFDHFTLIRPPAYALWIAAVSLTKIPLRWAIEWLFLGSAFFFAATLFKSKIPALICILLYAVIIFYPATLSLHNEAVSETFYTPLLFVSLGGMIRILQTKNQKRLIFWAALTGLATAILWQTRPENILIAFLLGLYVLLQITMVMKSQSPRRNVLQHGAIAILIPVLFIVSASYALSTLNGGRYGIYSSFYLVTPGWKAAHTALLRIKQEEPKRYISVPKETREKAYSVSPAFEKLELYLEGDLGKGWSYYGCLNDGICDDISSGWFNWAFRDAAFEANPNASAPQMEVFLKQIADEINKACDRGTLACRRSGFLNSMSFIPPYSSTYLPYLGSSFLRVLPLFSEIGPLQMEENKNEPRKTDEIFNRIAHRRGKAMTTQPSFQVRGWVIGLKDPVIKVFLRDKTGKIISSTDYFSERRDVADFFANKNLVSFPSKVGFELHAKLSNPNPVLADLVFATEEGLEYVIPAPLKGKKDFNENLAFHLDFVGKPVNLKSRIKEFLFVFYPLSIKYLTWVFLTAFLAILLSARKIKFRDTIYPILVLLAAVIASRLALFVLLDASSFSITDLRYLYPGVILYPPFCILTIFQASVLMMERRHGRKSRGKP